MRIKENMILKINLKTLIFLSLFQLTYFKISFSQDLSSKDFFIRVAKDNECQPVFYQIEELLDRYYKNPLYPNMSESLEKEFAKLLVQMNYLSDKELRNYFKMANSKYNSYKKSKNKGPVHCLSTSGVLYRIKKKLVEKYPWEWKFHLMNKYILIVECKNIYRDSRLGIYPFYTCDVEDDLKGNYKGDTKNVTFVGNYVYEKMEPGKSYMILVYMRASEHGELVNQYLIRGLVTDQHAIFPIEDDKYIIDKFNTLKTGMKKIEIGKYKRDVHYFFKNKAAINNFSPKGS